jgi:hypothetical protein
MGGIRRLPGEDSSKAPFVDTALLQNDEISNLSDKCEVSALRGIAHQLIIDVPPYELLTQVVTSKNTEVGILSIERPSLAMVLYP